MTDEKDVTLDTNQLGVTVSPCDMDGKQIGFIQCFSIIH